ncbi:hypothetical protein HYH02_007094 [Chlamydomonas schloesseri]|uniref:GCK domain-containing protein n=1 Tax=Chlamydomonas schloesseri TaxID=2026947 RepID=A0A835WIM9_9CHLO|nr:hypothetical protein HYH02_007094 [Chlamydomonas schloesseri]|eukprot:KAG2448067.1 hypothetical protein HYH02_007094 [Chlamydomonas schloesseri]
MSAPGEPGATSPGQEETREKDCAWCKIMQNKICKPQYDAFDACMEREGEDGDAKCMELFDSLRTCMAQKPSLFTMLRAQLGPDSK